MKRNPDGTVEHGDYLYRYVAVGGVERRHYSSTFWARVTGSVMERMTADELHAVAVAMAGRLTAPADSGEEAGNG